jgi:hypothetical protein
VDVVSRIDALDITLLEEVPSQTTGSDRRSLLALHSALAALQPGFTYVEIGSHLGGSLQALVRDPRCGTIVSIDPRPPSQPDERGQRFEYEDNSTQRMLDGLAALPGADLSRLRTIEASTEDLDPAALLDDVPRPGLCFVDGEHTDEAVVRDARFCRSLVGDAGAVAFHDAWIVHRGLGAYIDELRGEQAWVRPYLLPDSVLVLEFGPPRLLETPVVTEQVRDGFWGFLWLAGLREDGVTAA